MASAYAPAGVAGVDEADRRHVHRRTAVDDVADAGLARIDVAVVQPRDEPLLGEEDPLQGQRLRLQLRNPARLADHRGTRCSAIAYASRWSRDLGVDPDQRVRHQGVVGDVPVALVVRRDGAGGAPVRVERPDDAGHPAAVALLDLLGRPALGRAAERVADRGAGQHAARRSMTLPDAPVTRRRSRVTGRRVRPARVGHAQPPTPGPSRR